ncbi:hypothetical protein DFH28DRAFT_955497 [Melampsora americana]|nr:hypothetical protein DFH28DRAFT_955497 [Melampsora americana]
MNIFTLNISRIVFTVLPVFLIHLNKSCSGLSSEIIEESPEIIEGSPNFIEGSPDFMSGDSTGSDFLDCTDGEHQKGLPTEYTNSHDHFEHKFQPQASTLSKPVRIFSMERLRPPKEWSRIYEVGFIYSGTNAFMHVQAVIDIVLDIGYTAPSPDVIARELLIPTFHVLQEQSLYSIERMWAVAVLSYGKSHISEGPFKSILSGPGSLNRRGRGDFDLWFLKTFDLLTLVRQMLDLSHSKLFKPRHKSIDEAMDRETVIYRVKKEISDASRGTSSAFEQIFHSFIHLQTPTKLNDVRSLKEDMLNFLKENKGRKSVRQEKDYVRRMLHHLDRHHQEKKNKLASFI